MTQDNRVARIAQDAEYKRLMLAYMSARIGDTSLAAYNNIIAHIDAHCAQQVAAAHATWTTQEAMWRSIEKYNADLIAENDDLRAQLAARIEPAEPVGYLMQHSVGSDKGFSWTDNNPLFSSEWVETPLYATPPPIAQPAPDRLHVGDSKFESWFSEKEMAGLGTKQLCRDAYAAGMGDQGAQPAPSIPDVLFDGYAVYKALDAKTEARTSYENISDVLDAVVRLLRAAPKQNDGGE